MSEAKALYELQKIDLKLIQQHKRLNEIGTLLDDNAAVAAARNEVEAARQQVAPHRAKVRDIELDMQAASDKIAESDEVLYSGKIKNPKELQELQQEIDSLKRRTADLESKLLAEMEAVENGEAALSTVEQKLDAVIASEAEHHTDLLNEKRDLEAAFEALKAQRAAAARGISEEAQKMYMAMRKQKGGKPMAALHGNVCAVCGMEQTMAVAREVRRDESYVECANCGRILVDVGVNDSQE